VSLLVNHSMATIQINIDILNSNKIVEKRKGKLMELFANIFINKTKLKKEVEEKVCEEIMKQLQDKIPEALEQNGVKANISCSVIF
jgi:hypothetical protein